MTETKIETTWVLDQKPVTIQEWTDVMGQLPNECLFGRDVTEPVVYVTALEADEYARRIGGRLPTENELNAAFSTRAVERIRPATWEWTSTAGRSSRVGRGGGWYDVNADLLSASYRYWYDPEYRNFDLGLRCARPVRVAVEPEQDLDRRVPGPGKCLSDCLTCRHPNCVDPYRLHSADLRARGIEASSGCYGERIYHIEGVGISAEKPRPYELATDVAVFWGWGDWEV